MAPLCGLCVGILLCRAQRRVRGRTGLGWRGWGWFNGQRELDGEPSSPIGALANRVLVAPLVTLLITAASFPGLLSAGFLLAQGAAVALASVAGGTHLNQDPALGAVEEAL